MNVPNTPNGFVLMDAIQIAMDGQSTSESPKRGRIDLFHEDSTS